CIRDSPRAAEGRETLGGCREGGEELAEGLAGLPRRSGAVAFGYIGCPGSLVPGAAMLLGESAAFALESRGDRFRVRLIVDAPADPGVGDRLMATIGTLFTLRGAEVRLAGAERRAGEGAGGGGRGASGEAAGGAEGGAARATAAISLAGLRRGDPLRVLFGNAVEIAVARAAGICALVIGDDAAAEAEKAAKAAGGSVWTGFAEGIADAATGVQANAAEADGWAAGSSRDMKPATDSDGGARFRGFSSGGGAYFMARTGPAIEALRWALAREAGVGVRLTDGATAVPEGLADFAKALGAELNARGPAVRSGGHPLELYVGPGSGPRTVSIHMKLPTYPLSVLLGALFRTHAGAMPFSPHLSVSPPDAALSPGAVSPPGAAPPR
ncbi:MAG: hypothetical protein N3A38_16150, partial [Planctomycetota bacterium]|nr:hypothetical protein [Planctomycetota bacterium]